MLVFAIRRALISIPIMLASTFVTFLLVTYSGNPLDAYIGPGKHPNPVELAQIKHQLWLDQPLLTRYWHWIAGLFRGKFGPSTEHFNIRTQLFSALGTSGKLVAAAMVLAAILAVIVGVVSAVRQYSLTDYSFTLTGFLFLSLPVFWFAVLLKEAGIFVNEHAGKTVFYTIGQSTPGLTGGVWTHFVNSFEHLILPTITLALTSYAAWSRYNRASMLEVLNSDYVRLARAKGLSNRQVMVRHALRTALVPLVTVMALDIAGIIGSTVITETVYDWHAMGSFLLQAITTTDTFAVLAWLLVTGLVVILFNLFADLFYAVLDPRIRFD